MFTLACSKSKKTYVTVTSTYVDATPILREATQQLLSLSPFEYFLFNIFHTTLLFVLFLVTT